MNKKEIELTNDDIKGFFLVSFISNENIKNAKFSAFKIRGYYKTVEEAQQAALKLQEKDPYFDIFIGEAGKWMPINPDVNTVEDQIYREKELNELMAGYNQQRKEQEKIENERRAKLKAGENKTIEEIKKEEINEAKKNIETINESYDKLKSVFDKLQQKH